MVGEQLQPEVLLGLIAVTLGGTIGVWFGILQIAFGYWRPDWRLLTRRCGHMVIFSGVLVIGSQSQTSPAQAQQDATTRRVERLEDQATAFTAVDADLKAIVAQQKEMLTQLISANARQDERINTNADALQKIAVAAETIRDTQDQFANRVTWVGGILTTVIIVAGFFLDRVREKRMRNGHSPFKELVDIQKQILDQSKKNFDAISAQSQQDDYESLSPPAGRRRTKR